MLMPPMPPPGLDPTPPGLDPTFMKQNYLQELQQFGKNDSLAYTEGMSIEQLEKNNDILKMLNDELQKENKHLQDALQKDSYRRPEDAFGWQGYPPVYPNYGSYTNPWSQGAYDGFSMRPPPSFSQKPKQEESARDAESLRLANDTASEVAKSAIGLDEFDKEEDSGTKSFPPELERSLTPQPSPSVYSPTSIASEEIPVEQLEDGRVVVSWTADAKKLNSRDRQMVSPPFSIFPNTTFKIMISPKLCGDKKGQASFQKAKGIGSVTLKSMDSATGDGYASFGPELQFCISVGKGEQCQGKKGPIEHDFGKSSVCRNPVVSDDWNLKEAVDPVTGTFLVSLEVSRRVCIDSDVKKTEPLASE